MKTYTEAGWHDPTYYGATEHIVIPIDSEGTLLNFARQVDDVLIVSPEGEVLIAWAIDHQIKEFPRDKCLLLSPKDNLKEIGGIKTDILAIQPVAGVPVKVYITIQRN